MATLVHSHMHFGPNVGRIDRYARFAIAALMIGSVLAFGNANELPSAYALIALAAVPLVISAIIQWDPVYAALHVQTKASDLWLKVGAKTEDFTANLSVPRRVMRVLLAAGLIAFPIGFSDGPFTWEPYLILASIPVAITAIIGWAPIDAMVKKEPETEDEE